MHQGKWNNDFHSQASLSKVCWVESNTGQGRNAPHKGNCTWMVKNTSLIEHIGSTSDCLSHNTIWPVKEAELCKYSTGSSKSNILESTFFSPEQTAQKVLFPTLKHSVFSLGHSETFTKKSEQSGAWTLWTFWLSIALLCRLVFWY